MSAVARLVKACSGTTHSGITHQQQGGLSRPHFSSRAADLLVGGNMLIYFAAPLFCQAEQAYNLQLTEKLEARGFSVFLPQRDGVESSQPPYDLLSAEELRRAIFAVDREQVLQADIFLFVLDGRVPDEGACLELGIAYAQKHLLQRQKLIIGLHTDMRAAFPEAKLNAMLVGAFDQIVDNQNALWAALETYQRIAQHTV